MSENYVKIFFSVVKVYVCSREEEKGKFDGMRELFIGGM
jgi:hypothetical protein